MRTTRQAVLALSAALLSQPAFAQSDASLGLESEVEPVCEFTTTPKANIAIPNAVQTNVLGYLGYTCNFDGSPSLTLTLPRGTVLHTNDNGGVDQPYLLRWTVAQNGLPGAFVSYPAGTSVTLTGDDYFANFENKGVLALKLPTLLKVAGTYSTTITWTVTP